jgi:hypothetical protein
MADIRALERADLPAVAALLHRDLSPEDPAEQISRFLAAVMIDDPWSDSELPSLVATDDDGEVIGFIGAQVKRVRLDDRVLRGVCVSHLTVAADSRAGAAGALLLRRIMGAGQDFTISDTANDRVAHMWQTFGGHLDHGRSCDWMVVLKPVRWLRSLVTDAVRHRPRAHPVGAMPFQALRPRSPHWSFPEPGPEVRGEDVDAATIVEQLPEMTRGFQLWVDYDEEFLDYLFGEMESHFGALVRRLVWDGKRPLGWYAYVPKRGGLSRVLHVHTSAPDADAVLGDLLAQARKRGTAVLAGRLEPHLTLPLQNQMPLLGFARRPVIHCRDSEMLATLMTGKSLLTQLNSEWFAT